ARSERVRLGGPTRPQSAACAAASRRTNVGRRLCRWVHRAVRPKELPRQRDLRLANGNGPPRGPPTQPRRSERDALAPSFRFVRPKGAGSDRPGQPPSERGVVLGDLLEHRLESPLHVHARALGGRARAPRSAAKAEATAELVTNEAELGAQAFEP